MQCAVERVVVCSCFCSFSFTVGGRPILTESSKIHQNPRHTCPRSATQIVSPLPWKTDTILITTSAFKT